MATQIVMDHTGDTRHQFDPADAAAVAEAEVRFKELTGAGFTAARRLPVWPSLHLSCGSRNVRRYTARESPRTRFSTLSAGWRRPTPTVPARTNLSAHSSFTTTCSAWRKKEDMQVQ
jgi:hypothetical protein